MNKPLTLSMALLFSSICLLGQPKTTKLKKKEIIHSMAWLYAHYKRSYDDCVNTNKYSLTQRLSKYPFNKAVKIYAVSYPLAVYPSGEWKKVANGKTDFVKDSIPKKRGLIIEQDTLDHSTLIEFKELDQNQIAGLTNLIYNINWRKPSASLHLVDHGACYAPRNAIIFVNKNNKVIDYIEICFHCMGSHSKNDDRLSIGTLCTQKYDLMKQWFIDAGISYGTIKTEKDSL